MQLSIVMKLILLRSQGIRS